MDNIASYGTLVKTLSGDVGVIIESDWRREHHYLDRDLWVLVLVKTKSTWIRASDLQTWSDNA